MRYCLSLIRSDVISNYNHDAEFRARDGFFCSCIMKYSDDSSYLAARSIRSEVKVEAVKKIGCKN